MRCIFTLTMQTFRQLIYCTHKIYTQFVMWCWCVYSNVVWNNSFAMKYSIEFVFFLCSIDSRWQSEWTRKSAIVSFTLTNVKSNINLNEYTFLLVRVLLKMKWYFLSCICIYCTSECGDDDSGNGYFVFN